MIKCPKGHPNPDQEEFCQVCHAYLRWEEPSGPAPPPADPEPKTAGVAGSLAPQRIPVEPGQQVSCQLEIRNTGTIVDRYSLLVHSAGASWITADPPEVSLLPGAVETAQINFNPLRSPDVPAGPLEFAIGIVSAADPGASIEVKGIVDVGSYSDISATIVPTKSEGRRSGEHTVTVVNQGNAPASVRVSASDPEDVLDVDITPPEVTVVGGAQASVRVRVRPRKPILAGRAKPHSFKITVEPQGSSVIAIDGTMFQQPILPAWLLLLIGVIAALIKVADGAGAVGALVLAIVVPLAKRIIGSRFGGSPGSGHSTGGQGAGEEQVTPYVDIAARLAPRTSAGRRSAQHVLSIENHGGAPFSATLTATDGEGLLAFEIQPPSMTAPEGGSASATLRVRPRKRILLSGAKPRPFQVVVSPAGAAPFAVDGAMIQERFIPLWLLPFTGLALILVAMAVVLLVIILVIVALVAINNN